jgi:hypothetical protein
MMLLRGGLANPDPLKRRTLGLAPGVVSSVFVVMERLKGGLVGVDAFPVAGCLPFARLAHPLPQYGCTTSPSVYLGLILQCFVE